MTGRRQCQVRDCPRYATVEIDGDGGRHKRYVCGQHVAGMATHLEQYADVIITRPIQPPRAEPDQPDLFESGDGT